MQNTDDEQGLKAARQEIDRIDDEILRLLIQRESAVEAVAEAKGLADWGGNPVRFAREAKIIRRLHKNYRTSGIKLSFMAIVRIWHELIAAYTLLQNDYDVRVVHKDLLPLARSHFGDLVTITDNVKNYSLAGTKTLLVMRNFEGGDNWMYLPAESRIIGTLPFVHNRGKDAKPLAYIVGICPHDFSSDEGSEDVLCLALQLSKTADLNDTKFIEALAELDICAIATDGNFLYCERHARLPNGELSHEAWEAQLKTWQGELQIVQKIQWLGTYPKPLAI